MQHRDVLVIGGGTAGLSAAREAAAMGVGSITVLEAADTIGGRVHTVNGIEYGAQFLHDTSLLPLLENYGLTCSRHDEERRPYIFYHDEDERQGGLDRDQSGKYSITALLQEIRKAIADLERYREWSVERFLDEELMQISSSLAKRLSGNVRDVFKNVLAAELGAPLQMASLHTVLRETNTYSDSNYVLEEGYAEFPRRVAKDLMERHAEIRLRQPVTEIDWDETGVTAVAGSDTFHAPKAVITVPLGVLQKQLIRFRRALPAELDRTLDRLGNGQVCKFIYTFTKPFWDQDMSILRTNIPGAPMLWPNRLSREPSLTCFVGGQAARELQSMPAMNAIERNIGYLRLIFRERLRDMEFARPPVFVPWNRMANIHSGYVVRFGADDRSVRPLDSPVDGRLIFAGEAYSHTEKAGTVTGAWEDGQQKMRTLLSA